MRDAFAQYTRNRQAWMQHWRHASGPRPTIIVVHGWAASPWGVNAAFFSLPWFYNRGYDVALVTLPFHGRRRERHSAYSGSGLFSHGIAHVVESIAQGVYDVRTLIDYLFAQGVGQVGMTGLSLGGFTSAMVASTDERLSFCIPNSPPTDLAEIVHVWQPNGFLLNHLLPRLGVEVADFDATMNAPSPLNYPVNLPKERLFLVGGLADRLAPPGQIVRLWEHWDRPRIHWHAGNHVTHLGQADYHRRMSYFLDEIGFSEPSVRRNGSVGRRVSFRRGNRIRA
jgi:hypothetical protein